MIDSIGTDIVEASLRDSGSRSKSGTAMRTPAASDVRIPDLVAYLAAMRPPSEVDRNVPNVRSIGKRSMAGSTALVQLKNLMRIHLNPNRVNRFANGPRYFEHRDCFRCPES